MSAWRAVAHKSVELSHVVTALENADAVEQLASRYGLPEWFLRGYYRMTYCFKYDCVSHVINLPCHGERRFMDGDAACKAIRMYVDKSPDFDSYVQSSSKPFKRSSM